MTSTVRTQTDSATDRPPGSARFGLTAWCIRRRWLVLVAAAILVAGAGALLAGGVATVSPQSQLVGDSAEAERLADRPGLAGRPVETIVVTVRQGVLDPAAVRDIGARLSRHVTGVAGVAAVGTALPGRDGRSLILPVTVAADDDAATATPPPSDVVEPLLAATAAFAVAHPQLQVGQIGPGSIQHEFDATLGADFQRAEVISVPITLVVLLVAFGALVAAGVPLLLGIGSVIVALGLTAAASRGLISVDPNTQSLVLLIGLAVGVDYSLFVMRRVSEERAAGRSIREAIDVAGATAGRAVVISGLTVVVAMSGMLVAGGLFTSLAVGTILVVAVAVLGTVTVLPALLAVLGRATDAVRLPFSARRAARRGSVTSLWGRLAGAVVRRPGVWILGCGVLLVVLAVPALSMRTALGGVDSLPQDLAVVKAYHQLEQAAPAQGTALRLVVSAPAQSPSTVAQALGRAGVTATRLAHISGVSETVEHSDDGVVSVLSIGVGLDGTDAALPQVVQAVRDTVVPALRSELPTAQVHVGGEAAATDLSTWMDQRLPWVVGFVLLLTLVVMTVSFGSLWLAGASVVLNILSVGAAFGVLTLVFGGTWAEDLLDFTSTGAIASWLPMLMFVILFGLSMDYHVFVTSRVREAYDAGQSPGQAVRLGVARSATVVTSAAAVMIAVFAVFGTLSSLEMKQLGVGLAAAVLIDATLVRGILLPGVLALLGARAHTGPAWVPRIHH